MGRSSSLPKCRIMSSFVYRGPNGDWGANKSFNVGPGEEMPKLNLACRKQLLDIGKICEIDQYGENIIVSKRLEMNDEEISRMFDGKAPQAIINILNSAKFSLETLARMYAYAEKNRIKQVAAFLEAKV